MNPFTLCLIVISLTAGCAAADVFAEDGQFAVQSNLRAGVAKVDITPDDVRDFEVTGHRRMVTGVRDPLRAGVLILTDGETEAAIVTLDMINASNEMVSLTRERIESESAVPAENILIAASHNHSGPGFDAESKWGRGLIDKLGAAAKQAASNMVPVSVGYGEDRIAFGINRRKVINGRAVVRLNPDGPNDPRVKVLRFDDGKSLNPMAVVMHAVCHPCFFTWGDKGSVPYPSGYPKMSADFPGEAQIVRGDVLRRSGPVRCSCRAAPATFGPTCPDYPYRCADEADIQWAGRDLGRCGGAHASPQRHTRRVATARRVLSDSRGRVQGRFAAGQGGANRRGTDRP